MTDYFDFESDFVNSLNCIPMVVRLKLDTCGVKLKLHHWHQFSHAERESLVVKPCTTTEQALAYQKFLQALVLAKTGEYAKELKTLANPPWQNQEEIPTQVKEKSLEFSLDLTINQWQKLTDLQRFALIKLSQPGHENRNFLPALQEFKLI